MTNNNLYNEKNYLNKKKKYKRNCKASCVHNSNIENFVVLTNIDDLLMNVYFVFYLYIEMHADEGSTNL